MKRGVVFLLALLGACSEQPPGEPVMRTEIGSDAATEVTVSPSVTPSRASTCRTVTFEDVGFTHCIADPARHRIATDLAPDGGAPYRSLAGLAQDRPANAPSLAFAVNGGMFDGEGKPIGYYVEGGQRLQELNRNEGPGNFHMQPNGVFFGTEGRWQVRTSADFYASVGDRPAFGTQSGPMLVIAGALHPEITEDGPSKAIRNGVGIDAQGRAHFVISNGPVSFGKLARFFRDELKTANALFLDGNVSALWDPASDRLDTGAPLGPLIVVEERQ